MQQTLLGEWEIRPNVDEVKEEGSRLCATGTRKNLYTYDSLPPPASLTSSTTIRALRAAKAKAISTFERSSWLSTTINCWVVDKIC